MPRMYIDADYDTHPLVLQRKKPTYLKPIAVDVSDEFLARLRKAEKEYEACQEILSDLEP